LEASYLGSEITGKYGFTWIWIDNGKLVLNLILGLKSIED
jgi:hypothetical protein